MDDTKLKKLRFQLDSILTKIKMKENTVKLRKSYELELDAKRRELEDYLETLDFDNTEEVTFYPELLDDNFNTKILKKKEFFDYRSIKNDRVTIEDACDIKTGDFTLSNPQTFIRNFISPSTPYNGVLMWWGVGVGKTCGAISIAEQYKSKVSDRFSLKKTLVITSGDTITTSWRKQIFDPLKEFEDEETENRQCTGDSYSTEWRRLVREKAEKQKKPLDNEQKEKIAKKLIKENYEFYGYIAFAGFLQELESRALKIKSKKLGDEEAKILMIREVFSNRVIIIDEAHNTNPNSELMGKKSKDQKSLKVFPDCIKRVLRYSENTKLILLTATPINNQPKEILWLINLLLLNDNRGTIREDEIFNLDGSFAPDGKELLLKKSRGYISYMRSEDPVTYPERTNMLLAENENFRVYYPGIHGGLKMEKARSKDNYKYLPLIDNPMSIPQYVNYLQTINQNKSDKFTTFKKGLMGNNAKAKQNLIMMFPKKYKGGIHEFELSNSSEECFKILKNKPRKIYSWCKGFLKQENIGRYSSKFLTTLKCVKKLDGIALVHIQFKELARTFAMMLEDNGYDSLYKEDALLDTDTEKINRKYVLITGETNKKKLGKIIDFNNSSKNIRGKQLQVIIVTDVAKEGLSFFNIREIHIMSPWWHINRLEQIIGRGMRKCSHKLLPKEDRNVAIYYHTSTVPEFTKKDYGKTKDRRVYNIVDTQVNDIVTALKAVIPIHSEKFNNKWVVNNILRKETLDEYIYWLSVEKAITIAPIEALLKSNAVDCNLTKQVNQSVSKDWEEEWTCQVNEDMKKIKPNMNTYTLNFAKNDINKAKTIIRQLYQHNWVFKLRDIKEKINNMIQNSGHPKIDDLYILYALDQFVKERLEIVDYYGRQGYLIYIPVSDKISYYVFQPNEIEDHSLPIELRETPLTIKNKTMIVETENILGVGIGKKEKSKTTILDFNKIKKMIEYYEEISLNSKLVVDHILNDKSHLALKQQVYWLMYLDKLNSDEIELLLNMYFNDSLDEQPGLKDLIPRFLKNLPFNELLEEFGVITIPNVKLNQVKFYKFNKTKKQLKLIANASSEIRNIKEFLEESGYIKEGKLVVKDNDYGFKYNDGKNRIKCYGYLDNKKNELELKIFKKILDKTEVKLTKKGNVNKRNESRGNFCGTNFKKEEYPLLVKGMTGKEILKDVDKSKKDIIKGYKWGGKKIKGLKKMTVKHYCDAILFLFYYYKLLNIDTDFDKLFFKFRYETTTYTIPQLKEGF